VFEKRVQERTFGLKRDEVTGGWRKLHNEELHDLYSSPSIIIIKKPLRSRACSKHGEDEECIDDSGEKTRRK
jgi:hypothetical protein